MYVYTFLYIFCMQEFSVVGENCFANFRTYRLARIGSLPLC